VVLILAATDNSSGVHGAIVSNSGAFVDAKWHAYGTKLDWWVPDRGATTVYVKYRDRAGNESQVYSAITIAP